ncbi:MAG: hypothetical protein WC992_08915, partial [Acholeplasmataceae bacterium]
MLNNPGFEGGETTQAPLVFDLDGNPIDCVRRGEDNLPEGWLAWFIWDERVPWDLQNQVGHAQPETRKAPHKERILEGASGWVMYTFYRIHRGGLLQQVEAVVGRKYRFTIANHAWSSNSDDALHSEGAGRKAFYALCSEVDKFDSEGLLNYQARVGIDPTGGKDPFSEDVVWGPWAASYNAHHDLPSVEVVAENTQITVFTEHSFRWPFKHCDAYYDWARLEEFVGTPSPAVFKGPKLFPHAVGEGGTYDAAKYMVQHDCPFRYIKVYAPKPEDIEAARNLKKLSPTSKIILRLGQGVSSVPNVEGPDFEGSAQAYMDNILPLVEEYPEISYLELWNEQDPIFHVQMARFAVECMKIAEQRGLKLAVMSYSTGVPENEEWRAIWEQTDFFPVAKAGRHLLSLHAYSRTRHPEETQYNLLRPTWLYEHLLIPNDCVIPFVYTEYNICEHGDTGIWHHPEFPTVDSLLTEWMAADELLSQMWYCEGAALYSFGMCEEDYKLDTIWQPLCDRLLSVKDRKNAEPGESESYDRYVIMADPTYMSEDQITKSYLRGRQELRTVTPSWQDAVQVPRPKEWRTNTVDAGPMPKDMQPAYLEYVTNRDPYTRLVFTPEPLYGAGGYRQGDVPWGNIRLGGSPYTMATSGCLVTSITNQLIRFRPDLTPETLVRWLNSHEGFTSDGRLKMYKIEEFLPGLKLVNFKKWATQSATQPVAQPADLSQVRDGLRHGPVIIQVDYKPGTPEVNAHWVLIVEDLGDDFLLVDPINGEKVSLMEKYGREDLAHSVCGLADYRFLPTAGEDEVPVTTLIGFNDPGATGAFNWLSGIGRPSLLVIPTML